MIVVSSAAWEPCVGKEAEVATAVGPSPGGHPRASPFLLDFGDVERSEGCGELSGVRPGWQGLARGTPSRHRTPVGRVVTSAEKTSLSSGRKRVPQKKRCINCPFGMSFISGWVLFAQATAAREGDAGFAQAEQHGFKIPGWTGQREPALPPLTRSKAVLNRIRILTNTSWFAVGREDQSPGRLFSCSLFLYVDSSPWLP